MGNIFSLVEDRPRVGGIFILGCPVVGTAEPKEMRIEILPKHDILSLRVCLKILPLPQAFPPSLRLGFLLSRLLLPRSLPSGRVVGAVESSVGVS